MPKNAPFAPNFREVSPRHRDIGRDETKRPLQLPRGGNSTAPARRRFARARLPAAHVILFFRQMEMLLSSGILLADALDCLQERFPDRRMRQLLRDVHAHVAGARSRLSTALAQFPRSFSPAAVAVIAAGEEGGSALLAERFGDLAERIAYEDSHRRQIRRACGYPLFVITLALGLLSLLLGLVFPRLEELLSSLGGQLPPLTRAVIAAAAWTKHWSLAGLAAAISLPLIFTLLRRWGRSRRSLDRTFLRVPIAGRLYQEFAVALFCKIYRSLYQANQPAPEILEACVPLFGNESFRDGLRQARRAVMQGGATLSSALGATGLFPPLACLALEVGEQTGRLAEALDRVSVYYHARACERLDLAINLINPALTLAVVGGSGLIMISFFQALYQIVYAAH
jgi:type IV pilus assembly protein PilC